MDTPRLEIHLNKIKENAGYINNLLMNKGIETVGVTKGFCAIPEIATALSQGGIRKFGDSRIENLKTLCQSGIEGEKILIRLPMVSEAYEVIKWADTSVNSEIETIKVLSEEAEKHNKVHNIILMVDVGDLREGILPEEVIKVASEGKNLQGIRIIGLGTNVGCYGGVLPSKENTKILVDLGRDLEKELDLEKITISGGSTCGIKLVEEDNIPDGINQYRIGEGILVGYDSTGDRPVPGTCSNTMQLIAEVIELKEKDSIPKGEIGMDAFGNKPEFEDKGKRKRAILAIGKQDVDLDNIFPLLKGVEILGGSSDHLILDVTNSKEAIKIGTRIPFSINYGGMLRLMTSPYVKKLFK